MGGGFRSITLVLIVFTGSFLAETSTEGLVTGLALMVAVCDTVRTGASCETAIKGLSGSGFSTAILFLLILIN